MKTISKMIAVLLALTMALSFAACGTDKAPINFSLGLTDDGKYEGITAKDIVTLGEYKAIPLPASVTTVTKENVQKEIDAIMAQFDTTQKVTDRPVKDKDTVNIDYVGTIDGVEFEGGSTGGKGTDVTIGVTQYIDNFLEQLIGHKPGETFDVNVTFPDPYKNNPDLAGKPAVFKCTINHISEPVHMELTEEFVEKNLKERYGFTSIENMKETIIDTLLNYQVNQHIWETIEKDAKYGDIPEKLVENEMTLVIKQMKLSSINYGMSLEDMLSYQFGVPDEKTFRENYKESFTQQVKRNLLIQALAEDANLFASEEDVKNYFSQEGANLTLEDAIAQYGKGYVYRTVTYDKVMKYVNEQNPVPEEPTPETSAEKPDEKPAEKPDEKPAEKPAA